MVKFKEIKSKTVLNKYRYRDNWFWCRYSINPYRGCQFACNYCDAITEKYLVHENVEDFSRVIHVKINAPELLEKEIKRVRKDVIALNGVTDGYQPAERKYEISRRILEVIRDNNFPVHIVTKSDLVLRDIDLLSEIAENSWCAVTITIITFDKKLRPLLEPFAPSPERRLSAVKELVNAGILSGVDFTPIVPYLADGEENMRDVIKRVSESGARYILPGSMTLRGNQKLRFFRLLRENWPELIENYEKLYGNSDSPDRRYVANLNRKAFEFCRRFGIPNYIPPPRFERPLRENFDVANVLLLIAYFKEMRSGDPYSAWAYHKAAENIERLDRGIRDLYVENELDRIGSVGKSIAQTIGEFLDTSMSKKLERLKTEW